MSHQNQKSAAIYPRLQTTIGYENCVTIISLRTFVRKKGFDGKYYLIELYRSCKFAGENSTTESILKWYERFNAEAYFILHKYIIDSKCSSNESIQIDPDQTSEDDRLKTILEF